MIPQLRHGNLAQVSIVIAGSVLSMATVGAKDSSTLGVMKEKFALESLRLR